MGDCTPIYEGQCSWVYPIWSMLFLIGECMTVVNRSSLSFLPIHMILCRNRYSINPDCKCLSFCFLLICFHSSCQYSWLLFKFWTEVLSISKEDMPLFWVVQGASSTLTWVSSALHYWRLKEVCHPAGAVWYNACVVLDTFHLKWWKK